MADANQKRKFKCPNCDHWVKFKVNPESTLIACDHCGQLTRVTMKSSESIDDSNESSAKQQKPAEQAQLISQAFEDLDLEGLEHRDYVQSSTLGSINLKGRPTPPIPDGNRPDKNSLDKNTKQNKQQQNRKDSQAAPRSVSNETQPTDSVVNTPEPNVSLSAPLPPAYEEARPPVYELPIQHNQPSEDVLNGSQVEPQYADRENESIVFSDQPKDDDFFAATPPAPPQSPSSPQSTSPHSSFAHYAAESDSLLTPDPINEASFESSGIQWTQQGAIEYSDTSPLDLENLDPISNSQPISGSIDEQEPLEILEDMEILNGNLSDEIKVNDKRIICKTCDSLNYFPPADKYQCHDCFSWMDETGRPLKKNKTINHRTIEGVGDEIDDLISTAVDPDEPAQEILWSQQNSTDHSEIVDTTAEDLQSIDDDEDGGDGDQELRLAPLDEPSEDYRKSVLPHGFEITDLKKNSVHTESVSQNSAADSSNTDGNDADLQLIDADDELTELTEESDDRSSEQTNNEKENQGTDRFSWKTPVDLTSDLDEMRLPVSKPEMTDSAVEQELETAPLPNEPEQSHTSVSSTSFNKSLFLDGTEVESRPEPLLPSQRPAIVYSDAPPHPANEEFKSGETVEASGNGKGLVVPPPFIPGEIAATQGSISGATSTAAQPAANSVTRSATSTKPQTKAETSKPTSNDAQSNPATTSPLEYGWLGNWLPVMTSGWIIIGLLATSFGVAMTLWMTSLLFAADSSVLAKVAAGFGWITFAIPTAVIWIWLVSMVMDRRFDQSVQLRFDAARLGVHALRLGICFAICLPGLLLGMLAGSATVGGIIAMFYTSPIALFLVTISDFHEKPVVVFNQGFLNFSLKHQDLWLTAIGMVGMAAIIATPFLLLAAHIPMPGVFLAGPGLVLFTMVFALQVNRLRDTLRVLQQMDSDN